MRAFSSPPHLHPFPSIPTPRLIPPSALPPFTSSPLSHPSHITHHYRIPSFWIHHPSSLNHRFTTPYMSHRPPPSSQCVFPQPSLTPHPSSLLKSSIFRTHCSAIPPSSSVHHLAHLPQLSFSPPFSCHLFHPPHIPSAILTSPHFPRSQHRSSSEAPRSSRGASK